MDLRYSNLNPFKSLAYLKVSNNTKAHGLKSKIFQLCAFSVLILNLVELWHLFRFYRILHCFLQREHNLFLDYQDS